MDPKAGQQLLHYRLVEQIGQGAMGTVWLAQDTVLDRSTAIKFLPPALAVDSSFVTRFGREAKVLASLNHPQVASVYGAHTLDGTHFLAMEFVPGTDLSRHLEGGPLRLGDTVRIMRSIADALEAAHEKGVIHRDLKPGNIRLMPDGKVKVLDFGLAKVAADDPEASGEAPLTHTGMALGTAPYMSPEQVRGLPLDPRTDIWSFGCVLWECLTGDRPFQGDTAPDQLMSVLNDEPDWNRLPAGTPPSIVRLLRRCLAKSPEQRLHHIGDARLELDEAVHPAGAADHATASPPSRRRGLLWAALAVAAAVGITWFLAHMARREEPASVAPPGPLATARVTTLTNWPGAEFDAAISPDGRFLAFVSDRDGPYEVYVGPVDGPYRKLDVGEGLDVRTRVRNVGFIGNTGEIWFGGGFLKKGMKAVSLVGGAPRDLLEEDAVNADWSKDGRVVYHWGDGGDDVWVAGARGEDPELVGLPTEDGFHQHYPRWSPDGQWIYLTRGWETTGDVDLFRTRPDGTDLQDLTKGTKRTVGYPTPLDARTVLFTAHEQDGAGPWLWALDLETRDSVRASLSMCTSVSASDDGRRIVATLGTSQATLSTVPILGDRVATEADVEAFALPTIRARAPRARGEKLFYLSSPGTRDGLWLHDGDRAREVWPGTTKALLVPPAVAPDGKRVVMTLVDPAGRPNLWVINADGSAPRRLAGHLTPRGTADWSPDGDAVAVGGAVGEQEGLFKVFVDEPRLERIYPEEGSAQAVNPVWSPRGDMIVFAGTQVNAFTRLVAIGPDDGEPIEGFPPVDTQAGSQRFRFTPDGSHLVYMMGETPGQDFHMLDVETWAKRRLTEIDTRETMLCFDVLETEDGLEIIFDRLRETSDIVLFEREPSD